MRFFENDLKLETDTIFNFLCSSLVILVFAPFRLTVEVAKKAVFLRKTQIDMIMFTALIIGIMCTVGMTVIHMTGRELNLFTGRDPVVVYMVGCAVLIVLYFAFNTADLIAYSDSMVERVMGSQVESSEPEQFHESEEPVYESKKPELMSVSELVEYKLSLEKELEKLERFTQPEVKQQMDDAVGKTSVIVDLSEEMLEDLEDFPLIDPGLADIESFLL